MPSLPRLGFGLACLLLAAAPCRAGLVVDYTVDAGGDNPNGPGGLAASAQFDVAGTQLSILLTNTSTGVPMGAEVSNSLLVSIAFNLPDDVQIASGDSAVIGPGSVGLGAWSGLGEGDSVADQWLWTNHGGGDLLEGWIQIISTSNGTGGGRTMSFNGDPNPNVSGPFGGIAAAPPILDIPRSQRAVSDSILFTLTLTAPLQTGQLEALAAGSIVEFGSDFQYLRPVPGPGTGVLLALGLGAGRRRRRRARQTGEAVRVVRARARRSAGDRGPGAFPSSSRC